MAGMNYYFKLLTPLSEVRTKDLAPASDALIDPDESQALMLGEWVILDSTGEAIQRDASGTGTDAESTVKNFVMYAEKGRYDVQYNNMAPVIYLGDFEAETRLCLTTYGAGSTLVVGDELVVGDGDPLSEGFSRRVLKKKEESTARVVGVVTKVIGTNHIRFMTV